MDFRTGFGHALTLFRCRNWRYCAIWGHVMPCVWGWYLAAASHRITCCSTPEIYSNIPYIGWSHWFVLVGYRRFRMYLCGSMLCPESVSRYLWFGPVRFAPVRRTNQAAPLCMRHRHRGGFWVWRGIHSWKTRLGSKNAANVVIQRISY